MKLLFLLLLAFSASAQLPYVDGSVVYEEVIEIDSTLTQEEIKSRALNWIKKNSTYFTLTDHDENYVSAKGKIVGLIHQYAKTGYWNLLITFSATIDFKQGKYRYRFSGFIVRNINLNHETPIEHWGETGKKIMDDSRLMMLDAIDKVSRAHIDELKKEMYKNDNF